MHGNLVDGATKPLHPALIDSDVLAQAALPPSGLEISA